jgi:hypothetical protein
MKITLEGLFMADPPTCRISITCIQTVLRPVATLFHHDLTQHHNDFIVGKDSITK